MIVRRSQVKEDFVTQVMKGAECWTDHRLIISKIRLKIRPTSDSLQLVLSHTSTFYQNIGLSINISKTELMEYLPTPQQTVSELHI